MQACLTKKILHVIAHVTALDVIFEEMKNRTLCVVHVTETTKSVLCAAFHITHNTSVQFFSA